MLMRHVHPQLQFTHLLPYGAIVHDHGVQFVVFSRSATSMRVLLYEHPEDREPTEVIQLNPETDRWGDIWSVYVPGLTHGQLYHFQADGPWQPRLWSVPRVQPLLAVARKHLPLWPTINSPLH